MYIETLGLTNVRSFTREIIQLSRGINILVGKNNSGKSTIIRAAYCLQTGHNSQSIEVRKLAKFGQIDIQLKEITVKERNLFNHKSAATYKTFDSRQTIFIELSDKNKRSGYYFPSKLLRKNKRGEMLPPDNDKLVEFKDFSDSEASGNFIYPYLAKRKTDYYEGQGGKDEMYRVSENFRNLASKIAKISSPANALSEEFNRLCLDILQFKIGTIAGEGNNNFDVGIMIRDGETISLRAIGEGVANILGLIVILLTENNKLFFNRRIGK
ncbi:MAG TPA: AAA family ATPase [Bacteroidia bacterium]|nr:AAA family ATPase [Bacteroidia bacterium]